MRFTALFLIIFCLPQTLFAIEKPIIETWDYVSQAKIVSEKFQGHAGVVLHIGDGLTCNNSYGQWARFGKQHSDTEKSALEWMHCDSKNTRDGWYLCKPAKQTDIRSMTAHLRLRADTLRNGGLSDFPTFNQMLEKYQPQVIVLLVGKNDVTAARKYEAYRADMEFFVATCKEHGTLCVLTTLPPHVGNFELGAAYNRGLREVAHANELPLIDLEREILQRRAHDWNGTLLNRNDWQLTSEQGASHAASEATSENLRNSGYLLRGWLTVQKLSEIQQKMNW
jgi:GDSL-like Lipase/Acylhydrolase family